MIRTEDILSTLRMVKQENLDVRTITMGINLSGCTDRNPDTMCKLVHERIARSAEQLAETCALVARRYGIPIVNKRLSITPIARVADGFGTDEMLQLAKTLDAAAADVDVDLIGGFSAMVHGGMTAGARSLIESLPLVLSQTDRVCASVNVATSKAGINMDAIALLGQKLIEIADATKDRGGFGAAKLVIFANAPENNPFMAGAFLGEGEPDTVIHIGVSGPGVIKQALERLLASQPACRLNELAEEIKSTAFRITRVGELIGREVAARLGVAFGIVDLSLAPTPKAGDSIGEILQLLGIDRIGAPGSTAVVAMLNDAVKKGGLFASSSVGGLSGAFVPVMEDSALAAAAQEGYLTLEKLEAMTSVCSVGLDMIPVPGDTSPETLAALIADEMAIGVYNHKTTATRIIPIPGKGAGEFVSFGGLFGASAIMPIHNTGQSARFVKHGGKIPAPLQSLRN
ncbi:MAG: PFL family protein [Planctomycetota bacterium]|nr:PFL family protein [Planctomycetota bacterium]MDA1211789.1 PFL family protein [Planctomycetota bacterium]